MWYRLSAQNNLQSNFYLQRKVHERKKEIKFLNLSSVLRKEMNNFSFIFPHLRSTSAQFIFWCVIKLLFLRLPCIVTRWGSYSIANLTLITAKTKPCLENFGDVFEVTLVTSNVNYRKCSLNKICRWKRGLMFTPNCVNFIKVDNLTEM